MDPFDIVDYKVDLAPLLVDDEGIASFDVDVLPESELYGLTLGTLDYAPALDGTNLTIWLSIDSSFYSNPIFATGITLPIEVSVTTTAFPPRRRQRTVAVKVIQR